MNLQDELCRTPLFTQALLDTNHCNFDNIGSASLHGVIHGSTFTKGNKLTVVLTKFTNMTLSTIHGHRIALLMCNTYRFIQIRTYSGICGKITVNHVLCLSTRYLERSCQPIRLLTVHNAKINRLCPAPELRGNFFHRHPKGTRSGSRMKIRP